MRSSPFTALASLLLALTLPSVALAINHESDYITNLDNYRVCDGANPLDTCTFADVLSPSPYYIDGGTKGTLVHTGAGAVRLRIDTIKLDDNHPTWACTSHAYTCATKVGTSCGSGKECTAGPSQGTCCTVDANCSAFQCVDGPQNNVVCVNNADCDDLDNGADWNVVFSGNHTGSYLFGNWYFELFGDGSVGCLKTCPFKLGGTATSGSINTDTTGLTCTFSGDGICATQGPGAFNEVMIVDPEGNTFAIPHTGNATLTTGTADGDPAKVGDCNRTPKPGVCP